MIIHSPNVHQAITVCLLGTLAFGPPFLLWMLSANYIAYACVGALAWVAAVAAKKLVGGHRLVHALIRSGLGGALIWGMISGLLELGALWGAIYLLNLPFLIMVGLALGVGAASAEILYLIVVGAVEEYRNPDQSKYERWLASAHQSFWVAHVAVIERSSAVAIHVVSRLALVTSLSHAHWLPGLVALFMFVAVDGVATFGEARKWDWLDANVCRSYFSGVLFTSAIGAVFVLFWVQI